MLDKQLLRAESLKVRRGIPASRRLAKSKKIFRKLFSDPSFKKAVHIALYHGVAPEVLTRPFLQNILKEKKIYLPKVGALWRRMTLRRVRSCSSDLVRGAYGIMEPKASCSRRSACGMDLLIIPGVAFDRKGGRLGRGGGYYDKLLSDAKKVTKIGLCFREQLVKKVPMTARDVRMDKVITD